MTTTYYGYEIDFDETDQMYRFSMQGWIYEFADLNRAKKAIKAWK